MQMMLSLMIVIKPHLMVWREGSLNSLLSALPYTINNENSHSSQGLKQETYILLEELDLVLDVLLTYLRT